MKNVLYTCPFVPTEWIASHGLEPVRMTPEPSHQGLSSGVCPFAAAFIHTASNTPARAIIASTVCDQMRRSVELIASRCDTPVFLMNIPATWKTPSSMKLYRDELARLGRFLEACGGVAPTNEQLADTMLHYDSLRVGLRQASQATRPTGVPLILAGGPLRSTDRKIFDLIQQAGGSVVLDATASGEMTWPATFDPTRLIDDPISELGDAYFAHIPHAMRRPNNQLYEYLTREVIARGARGVIYHRHQWCDTWHAETLRLKNALPIPLLDLAGGDDESDQAYIFTRIQAFMEMLK